MFQKIAKNNYTVSKKEFIVVAVNNPELLDVFYTLNQEAIIDYILSE